MALQKNQSISLEIGSISSDGNGVGHHEGMAVFVPFTAVGDVATVRIVKPAKTYAYGIVEELQSPGEGRVVPGCTAFGRCGGCAFQHLTYGAELTAKTGFVRDALHRIGSLPNEPEDTIASPDTNRYRNKVQYPVQNRDGKLVFGYYAARSHRIVPCKNCLLQPALLNEIAAFTVETLGRYGIAAYNEQSHSGLVRHIVLRQSSHTGEVLLCLVVNGEKIPCQVEIAEEIQAAYPRVATVLLNQNTSHTNVIYGEHSEAVIGPGYLEEMLAGVPVRLGARSFFQVNTAAAELLFGLVRRFACPSPGDVLIDLYCGTGVIGLSMAAHCKQLIGVERVPQAIEAARESARRMGLQNTRFLCADAGKAAEMLCAQQLRPDIIMVDPPRQGCDMATRHAIARLKPRRIVMVSCNAATMARDLAFLAAEGYQLGPVQPVDLFPRTHHVECVCQLTLVE